MHAKLVQRLQDYGKRVMVAAVIIGIVIGIVSALPFRIAIKKIKTANPTHSLDMLTPFLLAIFASFIILVAGMVVCKQVVADVVVAYSIASIIAFIVGVFLFSLIKPKHQ